MAENVKELTNGAFKEFLEEKGLAIVDFFAEWCMPCVMMAHVFEEVAENNTEVKFGKVNVDDSQELANQYSISIIPCMIVFKDGKEIDRIIGSVNEEVLEDKIKEHS